jgi:hypothetical protein
MVIGIQALCFSLSALLFTKGGAIYASFVAGLLLSVLRIGFFPFSLVFSVFYGLLIESFFHFFKVNDTKGVKPKRLILLLADCGDSQWSHSRLFNDQNLEQVSISCSLIKGEYLTAFHIMRY